jgi:uncharacterized protein with HEPN domain
MAGMRDRIIHGYDMMDLEIVWNTAKEVIPRVDPCFNKSWQTILQNLD